jgi:hypothetical protein
MKRLEKMTNDIFDPPPKPTNTSGSGKAVQGIPPFTGGQSIGVFYRVSFHVRSYSGGNDGWQTLNSVAGAISIDFSTGKLYSNGVFVTTLGGNFTGGNLANLWQGKYSTESLIIDSIVRVDGQNDTGGNPASVGGGAPIYEGYAGNGGADLANGANASRNAAPKVIPPSFSPALGWGAGKTVTSGVAGAVGMGTGVNTGLAPSTTPDRRTVPPQIPSTTPKPTPKPPEIPKPIEPPEKKVIPPPIPPVDLTKINADLALVIGSLAAIKVPIDNINVNTTPEAQKVNAKAGTCEAFKPSECGDNAIKRNIDPISSKIDAFDAVNTAANTANAGANIANAVANTTNATANTANAAANTTNATANTANTGLLTGLNTALSGFVTFSQTAFGKILSFLDNTIVDRAMGVANFAINVHNALMLSNNLGKTLAGVVDTAMGLTPFRFTDTNGNATTASRAFSSNVSALIVNLIGQDLYTELTDDWKVANRIYQGLTNTLNKTERLLSGQSKIAQKGGIDVANIGNALRANGIVNPNSYPPMAATKEANTPTELLLDVNSPLSSISSGIKNLNAVTKNVSGTIKQVSAIQKEFGKLQDLTNKESKVRKSMRSQAARQAKVKAKFTMLQIKQLKAKGQKNANP